jgi:hypothetical protein
MAEIFVANPFVHNGSTRGFPAFKFFVGKKKGFINV